MNIGRIQSFEELQKESAEIGTARYAEISDTIKRRRFADVETLFFHSERHFTVEENISGCSMPIPITAVYPMRNEGRSTTEFGRRSTKTADRSPSMTPSISISRENFLSIMQVIPTMA